MTASFATMSLFPKGILVGGFALPQGLDVCWGIFGLRCPIYWLLLPHRNVKTSICQRRIVGGFRRDRVYRRHTDRVLVDLYVFLGPCSWSPPGCWLSVLRGRCIPLVTCCEIWGSSIGSSRFPRVASCFALWFVRTTRTRLFSPEDEAALARCLNCPTFSCGCWRFLCPANAILPELFGGVLSRGSFLGRERWALPRRRIRLILCLSRQLWRGFRDRWTRIFVCLRFGGRCCSRRIDAASTFSL